MNAKMREDGLRQRHDAIKMTIKSLLMWAEIRVECEVFNAFADVILQRGLGLAGLSQGSANKDWSQTSNWKGRGDSESSLVSVYPHNP